MQNSSRASKKSALDNPRVKAITIWDFKGFQLDAMPTIELGGDNLLLYGENGSGKTTIFTALKELLSQSPTRGFDNDFSKPTCLKNSLSPVTDKSGKVVLEFQATKASKPAPQPPMEWRIYNERPSKHKYHGLMAHSCGFLDYRAVLLTHFLDYENDKINLFSLVVETLLRDVQMSQIPPSPSFGAEWKEIQEQQGKLASILRAKDDGIDLADPQYFTIVSELGFDAKDYPDENEDRDDEDDDNLPETNIQEAFKRFVADKQQEMVARVERFIGSLQGHLSAVQIKANLYLETFDPWLEIVFDLSGITLPADDKSLKQGNWKTKAHLPLYAKFQGNMVKHPGAFFNEARLTAIALTIYLAALKVQTQDADPHDAPRLLVLDDVLVGLDMVHRLPILETVEKEFVADNWQVILLTFDKTWYEVAKQRLSGKWKCCELFAVRFGNYEKPVLLPDADHLQRARCFLEAGEVKAAAVHVRTKFEIVLKEGCAKFGLPIKYRPEKSKIGLNEFRDALVSYSNKSENKMISPILEAKLKHSLSWVFNPLSHSEVINSYRSEIYDAISAVEELESSIKSAAKPNRAPQVEDDA